jgi:signal transduction histidine kinase
MRSTLKELEQNKHPMNAAYIHDENGPKSDVAASISGFMEMINTREKLEEELFEARKTILEKDNFLANINHEIRTPMNCIIGFSELALEGDVPEKTREYLGMIMENAEHILRIIGDISDTGLNGKTVLKKAPVEKKKSASSDYYRAIGRIIIHFLNVELAIRETIYTKLTVDR